MGAFFKSFWSQLGRNTGKRVSNALYGDKWATPYRVAVNKDKDKDKKKSKSKSDRDSEPTSSRSVKTHLKQVYKEIYSTELNEAQNKERHEGYKDMSKAERRGCLYFAFGLILFAGTYKAILYQEREDVVLVLMLWIVAIIFLLFRYFRHNK